MKKYVAAEGDVAIIGRYDGYQILRLHLDRPSEPITFFNQYQENELREWIEKQEIVRIKAQKGLSIGGWYRKIEREEILSAI